MSAKPSPPYVTQIVLFEHHLYFATTIYAIGYLKSRVVLIMTVVVISCLTSHAALGHGDYAVCAIYLSLF